MVSPMSVVTQKIKSGEASIQGIKRQNERERERESERERERGRDHNRNSNKKARNNRRKPKGDLMHEAINGKG